MPGAGSQDFQVVIMGRRGHFPGVPDALTVTRLVRRMKNLLEIELGDVWVEGEISNLRRQASGHCYFSLKDEGAQLSCVLFRGTAARVKTRPEDGMQVRLFGEVSVYEARGQVQLIVKQVEDAGMGDLQAKFEALKRKLDGEGVFDAGKKKALPAFPRTVGLVTSPKYSDAPRAVGAAGALSGACAGQGGGGGDCPCYQGAWRAGEVWAAGGGCDCCRAGRGIA